MSQSILCTNIFDWVKALVIKLKQHLFLFLSRIFICPPILVEPEKERFKNNKARWWKNNIGECFFQRSLGLSVLDIRWKRVLKAFNQEDVEFPWFYWKQRSRCLKHKTKKCEAFRSFTKVLAFCLYQKSASIFNDKSKDETFKAVIQNWNGFHFIIKYIFKNIRS